MLIFAVFSPVQQVLYCLSFYRSVTSHFIYGNDSSFAFSAITAVDHLDAAMAQITVRLDVGI